MYTISHDIQVEAVWLKEHNIISLLNNKGMLTKRDVLGSLGADGAGDFRTGLFFLPSSSAVATRCQ